MWYQMHSLTLNTERKEKTTTLKIPMYRCRDTGMYVYIHTHTKVHTCIYIQKKPSAEAKCFHRQLTPIGHSQTQILKAKRITPLLKQSKI